MHSELEPTRTSQKSGRPAPGESAEYYLRYISLVPGEDIVRSLNAQVGEAVAMLEGISSERSRYRYAEGKWSIRQVWGHINDTERVMAFRALWFARGMTAALPSFDQDPAVVAADSEDVTWEAHCEEFLRVRLASISLFENLPAAWSRSGIASGSPITVRAVAFIIAGHLSHHLAILHDRYGCSTDSD